MPEHDCLIVGAGILGVATAHVLARRGHRVVVVERQMKAGVETSSRNSGVIHSGLYYPTGSLKATACVEGRRLLYARCAAWGIAHRRLGKLVVATSPDELQVLDDLELLATRNQAGDVRILDERQVRRLEPHLHCLGALHSPETGILDVHGLIYSHKKQAQDAGATFAFETTVHGFDPTPAGWRVRCSTRGAGGFTVSARVVVNAAGLGAARIAEMAGVDLASSGLRYHLCKGDYFSLASRHRERLGHLVYPVPSPAGLGVHLTVDLAGQWTAGPDTEYVDAIDYEVREEKRAHFAAAVRRYYPSVTDDDFSPAYSGIRPKLQGPGEPFRDFVLQDLTELGAPRMIGLLGIESPGITASEYLAEIVAQLVARY
jgi:L-2-hydroxyglutarate oxidase LhgO